MNNKKAMGTPVLCHICGYYGHTLVKVDANKYRHQNPAICESMKLQALKRT